MSQSEPGLNPEINPTSKRSALINLSFLRNKSVQRFIRNKGAVIGLLLVVFTLTIAIGGSNFMAYPPNDMSQFRLAAPGGSHPFGTDVFGRDLFSRILDGMRLSLIVGLFGTGFATVAGTVIGLIAGYFGGVIDKAIMAINDVFQAMPVILFAITIMAIMGPGIVNMTIAIAVSFTPAMVRITRGTVLALRQREYVEAMRALGASHVRIMFKHILPNAVAPVIVMATMSIGFAILIESSLAFIGLGPKPPQATLGTIVADGRSYIESAWWISTLSGFAIMLIVMGFTLLGDGLRDLSDHRGTD